MATRTIAIKISVDSSGAVSGAKAATGALNETGLATQKLSQLQEGLTNSFIKGNLAARAISMTITAVTSTLKEGASEAINFQFAMAKFQAISGSSSDIVESLSSQVRTLSVETGQSAEALAKAALEMSKMGLSASTVSDVLPSVAKLARGLDEDLVMTGKAVVGVLMSYGLQAKDAQKITEELAFTVKASALDIEGFRTAFQYVGVTASLAGVKVEELQAAMDVLSNSGISASRAGTGLRRVIDDLANSHSKASKEIGGTIATYGGLENAMEALAKKNLSGAAMQELFGRQAASVAELLRDYRYQIESLTTDTANASNGLGKMNEQINDTVRGKLDQLTQSWNNFSIAVLGSGGPLKSFLSLLGDALNGLANGISQYDRMQKFRAADPQGFKAALDKADNGKSRSVNMFNDVEQTSEYKRWAGTEQNTTEMDKAKDAIVQNLYGTLNRSVAYALAQQGGSLPKHLTIAASDQAAFTKFASAYMLGTADPAFRKGWEDASALMVEKMHSQLPTKDLPAKETHKDLNTYREMAAQLYSLGNNQYDAEAYERVVPWGNDPLGRDKTKKIKPPSAEVDLDFFSESNFGENAPGGKSYPKNTTKPKDTQKDLQGLITLQEHYAQKTRESAAASTFFLAAVTHLDAGIVKISDTFSTDLVNSIVRGKNAFKGLSDVLGDFVKQFIEQMISMIIQALAFKAVLASLNFLSPGLGQALVGIPKFATGGEFTATGPTAFVAGESGRERVSITPAAKMATGGSGGSRGPTIIIQGDVHDFSTFDRKVKQALTRNRNSYV